VKILVTGKQGKLLKTVAGALGRLAGFSAVVLPVGSRLLDAAGAPSLRAVLFALSSSDEVEPIRWILQQSPLLPVVAVLPRKEPKLRKQLLADGVWQVVEIPGMDASQIRRTLVAPLKAFRSKVPHDARQITADLHAIRSALTAILGSAEMALKNSSRSNARKQLQQVFRGVAEIENILRRIERALAPAATSPRKKAG
jgi:signal transduction histidine kinase